MFNSQAILLALAVSLGSMGFGFYNGYSWASTKADAERAQVYNAHQEQLDIQRKLADDLAGKLAKAEGRITVKTVEVIKYVPQVTTGNPCLNTATVGLLQPGANPGIRPPPGELTPEGAASASSDTDIAYWIAEANQHYETCAARLNALIDYEISRP